MFHKVYLSYKLTPNKTMKHNYFYALLVISLTLFSCGETTTENSQSATPQQEGNTPAPQGQSGVVDATSAPNIVQVAVSSNDHTTLVAAVKAAGLVDALSNAGPFTVFAPTNAAFEKLPKGTVDELLKPEKIADLKNILEYHTYVGVLKTEYMNDGQEYEEVNGGKVIITMKGDKTFVNGSEIIASIPTSNGIIHVINDVLLPK